jgi:hypothetical protein
MLDERISQLEDHLNSLKQCKDYLEGIEFHKCPEHDMVYGIRKGDLNVCKMCKRMEETS